ncbi:MAG: alpha/beta hydrolase [Clostridiales bacterium 38-18]|nr:MAG: alpha/beta hydrolase [Clostridiales bacterium 38-18]
MNEFEFKKIHIKNEVLAYREGGLGDRTLLLIHGNMSSSAHFDKLMDALYDDFKIYAVDLRGFGHSSYHERFDSLKELSEDLEYFIDKLRLKDVEVLGWSTGGGIAMHLAIDCPDLIKRVILLESVGIMGYPMFKKDAQGQPILTELLMTKEDIENDPVQVAPVLDAIKNQNADFYKFLWNAAIYTAGNQPNPEDYDYYVSEMLLQRNLVDIDYSLTRFNLSHADNGYGVGSGEIERIKCPVLIIQGDKDIVVPMDMAVGIKDALKDTAKLVVLENSAHNPMVDSLDKVVALIKEK